MYHSYQLHICKHFLVASLSISGPDPDAHSEPASGMSSFTVNVTLTTETGVTLGAPLEVELADGGGSACKSSSVILQ